MSEYVIRKRRQFGVCMEWQGQAKESVIDEIKTNKNHHHPRNKNIWVIGWSTKAQRSG